MAQSIEACVAEQANSHSLDRCERRSQRSDGWMNVI